MSFQGLSKPVEKAASEFQFGVKGTNAANVAESTCMSAEATAELAQAKGFVPNTAGYARVMELQKIFAVGIIPPYVLFL